MPIIGIGGTGGSGVAQVYPTRARVFGEELNVLTGTALTRYHEALQNFSNYVYNSTAANGDELTWSWLLAAGSYVLSILGLTSSYGGIIDVYGKLSPDGSYGALATGMDWYSAGIVYNIIKTANITISTDGRWVLKTKVNGKHASSSGYYFYSTMIWLAPSAD